MIEKKSSKLQKVEKRSFHITTNPYSSFSVPLCEKLVTSNLDDQLLFRRD